MKWICCQIGAREHYAVPRALHRLGMLELLITDAWIRPRNLLGRVRPGLALRFDAELAASKVYARNLASVIFEARTKIRGIRNWNQITARNEWFQRLAVPRLDRLGDLAGPRTVMAYSYAALNIFKLARMRRWRTVLAQIDPGPSEERIVEKLRRDGPLGIDDWQPAPPQYWSAWREECELADRIVVNSLWSQAALIEEGVPEEKIRLVPLAYEMRPGLEIVRRDYPVAFTSSRPMRVLFLGQVNLRKGIAPLLEAIQLLRSEPIEFSFVGPIQIRVPPGLNGNLRVRWIGQVSRQEAAQFYQSADVFLFPTYSDGFGLTQLEAQAWRLPLISSRRCGEVIEEGKNGWLLEEVTADAIANVLRHCCSNPACLRERSKRSRLDDRFSLARVGEQWLHIFD